MSRLKMLLHVSNPSTCNTQQPLLQPCKAVVQHAHTTQQKLLHVARASTGNTQQPGFGGQPARLPTAPVTVKPDERNQLDAGIITPEAELTELVNLVADHHGFSPMQRREALAIALSDLDAALECFTILAARIPQTVSQNVEGQIHARIT